MDKCGWTRGRIPTVSVAVSRSWQKRIGMSRYADTPTGRTRKTKVSRSLSCYGNGLNNGTNVFTILMRHYILETSNTPHCSMSIKLVMEITERIIYLTFPGWSNPRDQDVGWRQHTVHLEEKFIPHMVGCRLQGRWMIASILSSHLRNPAILTKSTTKKMSKSLYASFGTQDVRSMR